MLALKYILAQIFALITWTVALRAGGDEFLKYTRPEFFLARSFEAYKDGLPYWIRSSMEEQMTGWHLE